ncbi:unnamed protein product, partial [Trichobilharzia szidati]
VSHSEMKPFTGTFKENRSSFPTYTPRLATQANSVVSEANNRRFDYLPKSIPSNYTNGNQPVEQHFIPCTQESVLLRPPNSSTCLTQLLHNNNNNNNSGNNVLINPSYSQFNQKTNSRPNSIDSMHSQNSSDIHSNSNNNSNTLPNLSNPSNVNHLKVHLKSANQLKASNPPPYRELTHLSSSDWWIQPTNLLATSTQSLSNSSITFLPSNLTLPVNSLQNQNPLIDDYMQLDRITLENMNQKTNNNNTDGNTVEYGSTIMTTATATTTRAATATATTTDVSQLGSVDDYYQQSIMKNDLITDNNSDFICNDIDNNNNSNSNNNKNYYYDNIDYISCIGDFRNLPTYTPKTNRCQGNNPMGMMMMNQNTSNTIPATASTTTVNGNNNNNRFASCFNSQLSSETAFYCPERVSAVAAAAAAAAAMVAMTPGISNSPRHCSHHHYHHHHCYAHTHCHVNQNCRGDIPPPPPPPPQSQRHEEDNLGGIGDADDDGEGMEEDYDDDEDDDDDDELGDEDPKRYYHHYHHLIGQPVSPQHHQQQQQNQKSYDITDIPGSYANLEQNKTVRGYFPFDSNHTSQDETRPPLGNKTSMVGGDTLAYIDDYRDQPIEYYSRFNRSPKDWKTTRETDNIRSSQQEPAALVQYTGNNSKKYDLRLTGPLPAVSLSTINGVSSVPFSQLTAENFRDSNLTTISLSSSSDCMPDNIQTNLTNSLAFLPTNISASFSLDYLNPVWRNQSIHKMNQSLSDMPTQMDNNDNDNNNNNNNNNGDDSDNASKQIHSRLLINQIQNSKFEFSKQITTQSDNGVITVVNDDEDDDDNGDGDGDGDENRSIWSLNAIQQGECNTTEIIPINQSNFLTMNSMNFESASGVRDSSLLMRG